MRDVLRGLRAFGHDPSARAILAVAFTVIGVATIFYRVVEDLAWIDALYVSVITVSTVGYGDISPVTVAGKVFTMVFVLVGVGIFVALGSTVAHHLMAVKQRDG